MKTLLIVLLALVLVPVVSPQTEQLPSRKRSAIVDNLTVGIKSTNYGLRTGSANVYLI